MGALDPDNLRTALFTFLALMLTEVFPGGLVVKNFPAKQEMRVQSLVGNIPWRIKWQPTLVFLPGKSYGQKSQVD